MLELRLFRHFLPTALSLALVGCDLISLYSKDFIHHRHLHFLPLKPSQLICGPRLSQLVNFTVWLTSAEAMNHAVGSKYCAAAAFDHRHARIVTHRD